jgi:hypothetical protein
MFFDETQEAPFGSIAGRDPVPIWRQIQNDLAGLMDSIPGILAIIMHAGPQVKPAARRRRQPIGFFLGTRLVLQQHGEAAHKLRA